MCAPGAIKAEQNTSSTRRNIQQLEPQNIREPILDFTPHFGEINPDMLYICRRGLSGPQRAVFAFFPSKINAMTIYHIVNDINWLMQYRVTKQQQVKFICKYTILTSID